MLYVPQIGYMLAIQPWLNMPTSAEDFNFPDLKFMFIANNVPHFKSQRCLELDESMGDTATNICDHETSIMIALSAHILKQSALLTDFAHLGKVNFDSVHDSVVNFVICVNFTKYVNFVIFFYFGEYR